MPHRPTPAPSLADEAYALLHRRITRCELAPGSPVTAGRLAAELDLGITPVREALIRLHRERLVVTLPRRGYLVAPVTAETARQTYTAWEMLRPGITGLAVSRMDDATAARVAAAFDESYRVGSSGEGRRGLELFSRASIMLADATGNPFVVDLARRLEGHLLRMFLSVVDDGFRPPAPPDWSVLLRGSEPAGATETVRERAGVARLAMEPVLARLDRGAAPDGGTAPDDAAESLADTAYAVLRAGIVRGDPAPGTRFTAGAAAAAVGLGVTPVREALARLDADRLVVTLPRSGYQVTGVSREETALAVELWGLLAPAILELAVVNGSVAQAEQVAALTSVRPPMPPGTDPHAVARDRAEAWRVLARAGGNDLLAEAYHGVEGVLTRAFALLVVSAGKLPTDPDWVRLVRDRDVEGARRDAATYVATASSWVDQLASNEALD